MELSENLNNTINNIVEFGHKLEEAQTKFVQSNLFNIINNSIDGGLRIALPDFAEDVVIDIKNSFIQNGFENGIKEIWSNIKEIGKSMYGLISGQFETIDQIKNITENGGILDSISKIFDFALEKAVDNGKISKDIKQNIKSQKNSIIKEVKDNISKELDTQNTYVDKIDLYNKKWNESFQNKDLKEMKNAFKNINKYLEKTLPLENIIKEARKIEILQNLVENTGNFDITEEEKELATVLTY